MRDRGSGREQHSPSAVDHPLLHIGLFAVEPEGLVEPADFLEGLAADQQARSYEELDFALLVVGPGSEDFEEPGLAK